MIDASAFGRRFRTNHPGRLDFRPRLELLEGRTLPATLSWVNPAGGDWDTASNWDAGRVPTAADDAVIGFANLTVTHATAAVDTAHSLASQAVLAVSAGSLSLVAPSTVANRLVLSGGTLAGPGDLTVAGSFTWTGGTLSGPGHTLAQGGMTLDTSASPGGPVLDDRSLDNAGQAVWTGTHDFSAVNGAVFHNLAGATFDVQSDADFATAGLGGTFHNDGTLRRAADGATTVYEVMLDNDGVVQVLNGTLSLAGGGSGGGRFAVGSGATLGFDGGNSSLSATSQVVGAGTVRFGDGFGASVTAVGGRYAVNRTTVSGGSVLFANDVHLATLSESRGRLGGPGTVTVEGPFDWAGGSLSGPGRTRVEGTLSFGDGVTLDGRALDVAGAASWTTAGGTMTIGSGGVLTNLPGATFDVDAAGLILDSQGPASFVNAGTFRKSAAGGSSNFQIIVAFTNSGAVAVEAGTLSLAGSGSGSGTFSVVAGATLDFSGGNYVLGPTSSVTGDGTVRFGGFGRGSTVSGTYAVAVTTVAGGVGFYRDVTFPTLNLSSGFDGDGAVTVTGTLNASGGNVSGSGRFLVTGNLNLTGTLTLYRNVENAGTATWTGAGNLVLNDGSVFTNRAGATADIQKDGTAAGTTSEGGVIENEGTLRKTSAGDADFNVPVDNNGTVDVEGGTLTLQGIAGVSGGSFNVGAGNVLNFAGINHTLAASSVVAGAGTVRFSAATTTVTTVSGTFAPANTEIRSGTVNFSTDETLSALTLGGTLGGAGTVTVQGLLTWQGGTLSGPGRTRVNGNIVFTAGSVATLSGRTLETAGTTTWATTAFLDAGNGALWDNLPGATFDAQNDMVISPSGGSPARFLNEGTFRKSAGSGTTTVAIAFTNAGTLDVQTGRVALTGELTNFSAATLAGGTYLIRGTFQFANAAVTTNAAAIVLDGTASQIVNGSNADALAGLAVNLESGSFTPLHGRSFVTTAAFWNLGAVALDGASSFTTSGTYTQSAGSTELGGGVLTAASLVDIEGGTLNGPGTVRGDLLNAGLVRPGGSEGAGLLTVTGNYMQTATGVLNINLGGLLPGSEYDELAVAGMATLDGTLNVTLIGGFLPQVGDGFQVLTYAAVGGDFAVTAGLDLGSGLVLDPLYGDNALTLQTEQT